MSVNGNCVAWIEIVMILKGSMCPYVGHFNLLISNKKNVAHVYKHTYNNVLQAFITCTEYNILQI